MGKENGQQSDKILYCLTKNYLELMIVTKKMMGHSISKNELEKKKIDNINALDFSTTN